MSSRALLAAVIAALAFLAAVTGVRLAYALAYTLTLLLCAGAAWSWLAVRRLAITRISPVGRLSAGELFQERFTVRNDGLVPAPWCELTDHTSQHGYRADHVCSLGPRQEAHWTSSGTFSRRGRHTFGPLEISVTDPFGLFTQRRLAVSSAQVLVHPRHHLLDIALPNWGGQANGEQRRGRPLDVPPDVASVRDYESHDGQNRIHWASTARTGRLMSRVYDTRQSADILVVLDLGADVHAGRGEDSSVEYAITLAASIVHTVIAAGQAVGLTANDGARTSIAPGRGALQEMRLLDYLAEARADGVTTLASTLSANARQWHGRGGLVVITPSRDPGWVAALVDSAARQVRHLAISVDTSSFGAAGAPLRPTSSWRSALDWWVVRRGDALTGPDEPLAVAR